jgi:hypothetical protein
MSDTIRGIEEIVEDGKHELLAFRNKLIKSTTGLGPPDLVILFKRYVLGVENSRIVFTRFCSFSHFLASCSDPALTLL